VFEKYNADVPAGGNKISQKKSRIESKGKFKKLVSKARTWASTEKSRGRVLNTIDVQLVNDLETCVCAAIACQANRQVCV
jgi:hypothetical protein